MIYSQWEFVCKSVKHSAWQPAIATSPNVKENRKNSTSCSLVSLRHRILNKSTLVNICALVLGQISFQNSGTYHKVPY